MRSTDSSKSKKSATPSSTIGHSGFSKGLKRSTQSRKRQPLLRKSANSLSATLPYALVGPVRHVPSAMVTKIGGRDVQALTRKTSLTVRISPSIAKKMERPSSGLSAKLIGSSTVPSTN